VERLVAGGSGLLRDDRGVVFVEGVAVGERITYIERKTRRGARRARLLAVLEPSSDRVEPVCTWAGHCGGCDWLHLRPSAQAHGKEQIVKDALSRIGRLPADVVDLVCLPIVGPRDPQGRARRRARLNIDAQGRAGFFARESHELVVVDACPALDERLSGTLARLPKLTPHSTLRLAVDDDGRVVAAVTHLRDAQRLFEDGLVAGVVVVDEDRGSSGTGSTAIPGRVTLGDPLVRGEVTAGLFSARSDANCFTQATRFGGRAIVDVVLRGLASLVEEGGQRDSEHSRSAASATNDAVASGRPSDGSNAGGHRGKGPPTRVLELFAGSGHLTLPLAAWGAVVDAVEGDGNAVGFLEQNVARFTPPGSVRVRRAYIDGALRYGTGKESPEVVVADPPRTGIPGAPKLFSRLWGAGAKALVLVSCDPATGARDLRAAVDAGFALQSVQPIDAFPGTHHVEWVACLRATPARRPDAESF
jgi:23S rRNA (uracil1939-C5)-methyltransferase